MDRYSTGASFRPAAFCAGDGGAVPGPRGAPARRRQAGGLPREHPRRARAPRCRRRPGHRDAAGGALGLLRVRRGAGELHSLHRVCGASEECLRWDPRACRGLLFSTVRVGPAPRVQGSRSRDSLCRSQVICSSMIRPSIGALFTINSAGPKRPKVVPAVRAHPWPGVQGRPRGGGPPRHPRELRGQRRAATPRTAVKCAAHHFEAWQRITHH